MNFKNRFLTLFLLCLGCWIVTGSVQGQGFSVGNYQVLSSTRVGRTEFEYVISVTISNQVASAVGVSAQVYSISTNTVIIQGDVNFGDVAFGASAVSTNTITISQNRLAPFNPADLAWFFSVKSMPLSLTVISPMSGFLTNGTNVVVTGTIGPAVDGVTIGRSTAALNGTNFSGTFTLEEGRNTISVLASNQYGGSGLINVIVTRDTTPPLLNIETPTNGTVLAKRQVTISGLVNDAVPGTVNPEQASVMVNGLAATILNRSFSISDVLLVPGTNTVTAIARDRAGNEKQTQIQLVFIDPASQKHLVPLAGDSQTAIVGTMLPQPLLVELVDGDGVVQTNQPVTFAVTRNDGILFASPDSGRTLTMLTDEKGQAKVLLQLGTRTGVGNNQVVVTSPGVNGQLQFEASAVGAPPAKISPLIPETQVGEVGKPLPQPWTAYATDSGGNPVAGAPIIFTVSQGGGNFGGATTVSTNTDSDGRAFVTLTLGPDEGINNNVVLAGSPGVTNSSASFTASGQTPGAINATRVVGLVLDNANRPMSNILCMIANTTRATVTDQQGQFAISGAPVGAIRLIVDAKNRGYPGEWHDLQFNMVTVAGRDNSLDRPVYMVQVDTNSAAMAGGSQDVVLHLKDFPGATLTIFAHSVRNDQGQPVTNKVTWTQVNAERIPMAPPQGSQPVLTTAVLPAGIRFDPPAKMCIPNTAGLPPGQILELYGFDHDIGSFVSRGTATVSSDGTQICSDTGFGVTKSGWFPFVPPPPPCTGVCSGPPPDTDCTKYEAGPPAPGCTCPTYTPKQARVYEVEGKGNGKKDKIVVCINEAVNFTATAKSENCSGSIEYEWDFNDGIFFDTKMTGQSVSFAYTKSGNQTVDLTAKCSNCPSAEGTASVPVTVIEVDSVLPASGTEVDDGDGNDDTKTFFVFTNSLSLTVDAKTKPSVAEADLPAGWSFTGGTGAGKLQRTLSLATPGKFDFVAQCNTSKKTTTIYVVGVGLVTPKGDPVASPVDSGSGQNEFTFETATFFAKLTLNFEASVSPGGLPSAVLDKVKDKVFFTADNVGSSPSWDGSNPGGRSSISGSSLVAIAKYSGLPDHNSDFGKKNTSLKVDGATVETVVIEVFFPKDAANNPGGILFSDPNWFYYWKEGGVCGIPADAQYDGSDPTLFGYTRPGVDTYLRLGLLAPTANTGPETFTKTGGGSVTVTGVGKGLKCVAETVRHEVHHLDIYNLLGSLTDTDGDGVADTIEATLDGLNTSSTNADTYNMHITYPGYLGYGDNEIRCRKVELSPPAIFVNKDWANPGAQSKTVYGP